ncbi:uncharacterized protein JCM6883_003653 [Sporobolomyces salmoneus]|uniref:uncharacterized protein n=1 Tax=Sporobolomyces salmoneus TaxID=183962 RepID=UPI0031779038
MGFTQTMLERYDSELKVAIEHPFLTAAGKHELAKDKLSEWLTQDRIYALCGYPKFIASLICALSLSSTSAQRQSQSLLGLFSFALANIDREVGFFDSLGPKYGLNLEFRPPTTKSLGKLQGSLVKPTTKAYVDLLIATGAEAGKNGGLEEALVLLWGMEKIYLLAWTHAKSQTPSPSVDAESPIVKALKELINNWTMEEFVQFVERIEKEVERLDLKEGTEAWERCEEIFKYNLLLEQQFWPDL